MSNSTCIDIICPDDCSTELPPVVFSLCSPEINYGQIARMFLCNPGYPLNNENDPVEWQARMDVNDATKIIALTVVGDKPPAESNEIEISRGRIEHGAKKHTINVDIDETNDTNYEFMRKMECGKSYVMWYETYGGQLYGGRFGCLGSFKLNDNIPKALQDINTFVGAYVWKSKFHPCRTRSVVPGQITENNGSGS